MLTSVEHLFDMYILFIQYGANLFDAFFQMLYPVFVNGMDQFYFLCFLHV